MAANRRSRRLKMKRRRWLLWGGVVLLLIIAAAGLYLYNLYNQVDDTVETIHEPLEREQDPEQQEEIEKSVENKETLNFLLLGVDERMDDAGRSDSMVFLSANPRTESILMVSISRDARVEIPGYGMDKINHAYAFGGVELSVETVENLLDVPIHFYIKMNMEGFRDTVAALDGVKVENQFPFTQGGTTFPAGELELSGEEALQYVRMRKDDPEGDFGRTERQRQVLKAAMDKTARFTSIAKFGEILESLGDNVKTDIDMDTLQNLFSNYRQTRNDIRTIEIDGEGGYHTDNIWYYQVPEEEWERIHDLITTHMEAPS